MRKVYVLLIAAAMICAQKTRSQDFGSILGQIGEGVTLGAILKNPNLQSADLKNYLAFVNAGHNSYNTGKYGDAMSHYNEANKIALRTADQSLKKLYYNYGWKAQLTQWYNNAYTQYKLQNPQQPQQSYTPSAPSTYSGGTYSSPYSGGSSTTTTPKTTCRLCGGTGRKIKEYYSAGQTKWCSTCGRQVGTGHQHVTCDLCHGTGQY